MTKKYYFLYEINQGPRCGLGTCITDGGDRKDVIEAAEDYYQKQDEANGRIGKETREMILVIYDEATGAEASEHVTISWEAEKCEYDGGRWDYLVSIGAR